MNWGKIVITQDFVKVLRVYFVSYNNLYILIVHLKGRYTFGNCQIPVFSLGVSHHNHKITSLWKFGLNRLSKLRENDERKNTLVGRICVLSDRNKRLLARSLLLFE